MSHLEKVPSKQMDTSKYVQFKTKKHKEIPSCLKYFAFTSLFLACFCYLTFRLIEF